MTGLLTLALALSAADSPFPLAKPEAEISEKINVEELKAHVYRLASPEFAGRRGAGGARTSRHIAEIFKKLKLRPAFGDSYFQEVKNFLKEAGPIKGTNFIGRNVGAVLPGTDPKLKDEWILLTAHFDHLGVRGGHLYPGADDNASGVAMLIEVAERLVLSKKKPRRTIVFVSFDLEESGLLGSRYFALYPPRDLKKLKCFLTADMLGRSMANVMDEYVFLMGSETAKELGHLVKSTPIEKGLKVGRLGADIIGTRSDYGPFRDRSIPFLFFSTGQNPDYHQPTDLPDRIDYHRLRKISRWIHDLTWRLANDEKTPVWLKNPEPDLNEVATIHTLITRVRKNPQLFPLNERQLQIVQNVERRLSSIQQEGEYTRSQRTWLIWTARILLITLF